MVTHGCWPNLRSVPSLRTADPGDIVLREHLIPLLWESHPRMVLLEPTPGNNELVERRLAVALFVPVGVSDVRLHPCKPAWINIWFRVVPPDSLSRMTTCEFCQRLFFQYAQRHERTCH